jgi:putative transposase
MFRTEDDFAFFAESLRKATRRFDCRIHAYVFMTNHVHLLLTPVDATAIGRAMQALGARYVRQFNATHARTGTLFEGRYRSAVLNSDAHLFACFRYIEENPLRAGLAHHPSAYRWSSYQANALGVEDPLLTAHEQYLALGPTPETRRSAYRALFQREIAADTLMAIRSSILSGVSLDRRSVASPTKRGARYLGSPSQL